MTISNSSLVKRLKASYKLNLGQFYFLNNPVIAEFKEDVHLALENTKELYKLAKKYFGAHLFGHLTNRIHTYFVNVLDYALTDEKLNNIVAFCAVYYRGHNKSNIEIENQFTKKYRHV